MSGRRRERRSAISEAIERRYRPPGSVPRAEVREASIRGDRDALRRLAGERGGLEGEHDVRFGLELPGSAMVGEVSTVLRDEGYAVELQRGEGTALLVARARLELTEPALRRRTERFCDLAERYAGRYRGFALETPEDPPGGPTHTQPT